MHTIAPILCYLVGAMALTYGIIHFARFIRCRRFPSAAGQLLSKGVAKSRATDTSGSGPTYLAAISYSYSVGDTHFKSSQVFSICSCSHFSRVSAQKFCDRLAAQSPLAVFYDPARPSVAFLQNGPLVAIMLPLLLGIVFIIAGVCIR